MSETTPATTPETTPQPASETAPDDRQQAILNAAFVAFATYGFRKTSMDDIAKGAGVSRPALYLRFRNKEDVFRQMVAIYYDTTVAEVAAALQQPGTLGEVLDRAFAMQAGEVTEKLFNSSHGIELMDTSHTTAADLAAAGEARLRAVLAAWLSAQSAAGKITLDGPPEDTADAIAVALKGAKMAGTDYATYCARLRRMAALFAAALAPRVP